MQRAPLRRLRVAANRVVREPTRMPFWLQEGDVLLLLALLFPVAVYLAVLGWLNRRPHGFLVSGPWDFCGVLFAASGFLTLGGPALIDSLSQSDAWRRLWLMGKAGQGRPLTEYLELGRALLYGGYFLLVVSASAFLLWRRRRLTAVYNVDPTL